MFCQRVLWALCCLLFIPIHARDIEPYARLLDTIMATYSLQEPCANTYRGIILEPRTFAQWVAQPAPATAAAVRLWAQQNSTLLERLLMMPPQLSQSLRLYEENQRLLKSNQLRNLSIHNYVFALPEHPQHYIKISGQQQRAVNIIAGSGHENILNAARLYVDTQQINSLMHRTSIIDTVTCMPTYQTISHYAYYLRAQEATTRYNLNTIHVARTEVVQIKPGEICDDTCIIVQEKVKRKRAQRLHTEYALQLLVLIVATGIWDIHEQNVVLQKHGIALIDLEQPNRRAPQEFFHKTTTNVMGNIASGLDCLAKMLRSIGRGKQFKHAQALVNYMLHINTPFAQEFNKQFGAKVRKAYKL